MILLPQTKVLWIQRWKVPEISKCLKSIEQNVLREGGRTLFFPLSSFLQKESSSREKKDTFHLDFRCQLLHADLSFGDRASLCQQQPDKCYEGKLCKRRWAGYKLAIFTRPPFCCSGACLGCSVLKKFWFRLQKFPNFPKARQMPTSFPVGAFHIV